MKKAKRIFSVIIALTLILTVFSVMSNAQVDENKPAYTVTHRLEGINVPVMIENADYEALTNNLLGVEQVPVAYFPATDESGERTLVDFSLMNGKSNAEFKKLTDRQIANIGNTDCWAQLRLEQVGTDASTRNVKKIDLEYDLGSVCDVERFLLASTQKVAVNADNRSWYAKYFVGQYEVYLADNKADLYNSENLIYSFDQPDDETQPRSGLQDVIFSKAVRGRYVAIRILDAISPNSKEVAGATGIWPHIAEIGVFGEKVYTETHRYEGKNVPIVIQNADYTALTNNLLGVEQVPVAYFPASDEFGERTLVDFALMRGGDDSEFKKMTNRVVVTSGTSDWAQLNLLAVNNDNSTRNVMAMDLEYDLGSTCDVERFVLSSSQHNSVNDSDVAYYPKAFLGEYEVYLSNNKAELYNPENLIYSFKQPDESQPRSGLQDVTFNKTPNGKYLAIRILSTHSCRTADGVPTAYWPRITEIGVFGSRDYSVEYRTKTNYQTYTYSEGDYAAIGTNLLKNKKAIPYLPSDDNLSHTLITNLDAADAKLAMLTDGLVSDVKENDDNWSKLYTSVKNESTGEFESANLLKLDLEYDLGGSCSIDRFIFVGNQTPQDPEWYAQRSPGKYDVYLSDSLENLYSSKNLIYSYDYKEKSLVSGVQEVNFNKEVKGRYLAIRILDPISMTHPETGLIYPRIAEIGTFGNKMFEFGDINEDAKINIVDAFILASHLNGADSIVANADMDDSNSVDYNDLAKLRTKLLN